MIYIVWVAPLLIVFAGVFAFRQHRNDVGTRFLERFERLSEKGSEALDRMGEIDFCPVQHFEQLSFSDQIAILLSSRSRLVKANDARLVNRADKEMEIWCLIVLEDHRSIRRLLVYTLIETALDKLFRRSAPIYPGELLWTFSHQAATTGLISDRQNGL